MPETVAADRLSDALRPVNNARVCEHRAVTLTLRPLAVLEITIAQHTRLDGLPTGSRIVGEASACELHGDRIDASQSRQLDRLAHPARRRPP